MDEKKINLLTPDRNDVRECLKDFEEDFAFADRIIYSVSINEMRKIRLCEIRDSDIRGPIRTFVLNWGMMEWVLKRTMYKNWEKKLKDELVKLCSVFEKFRIMKLEKINIASTKLKEDIKHCFDAVRKIVGPTSASKILHLICPDFFPLWDRDIRIEINRASQDLTITDSAEGYFAFMVRVRQFCENYDETLNELSDLYDKKPILKILDEFWWIATR